MNNNHIKKSQKDIPTLIKYAEILFKITKEIETNRFSIKETDHFGFMCVSFFFKQVNHYKSVIQLVHLNQNSDATVIARVMLEGFFYLLWAKLNPERRAKDWRSYALVSDYKLFLQNKYKGKQISLVHRIENITSNIGKIEFPFIANKTYEIMDKNSH